MMKEITEGAWQLGGIQEASKNLFNTLNNTKGIPGYVPRLDHDSSLCQGQGQDTSLSQSQPSEDTCSKIQEARSVAGLALEYITVPTSLAQGGGADATSPGQGGGTDATSLRQGAGADVKQPKRHDILSVLNDETGASDRSLLTFARSSHHHYLHHRHHRNYRRHHHYRLHRKHFHCHQGPSPCRSSERQVSAPAPPRGSTEASSTSFLYDRCFPFDRLHGHSPSHCGISRRISARKAASCVDTAPRRVSLFRISGTTSPERKRRERFNCSRGISINLTAWYPYIHVHARQADMRPTLGNLKIHVDSVGMFVVGPVVRVRLAYDETIFGIKVTRCHGYTLSRREGEDGKLHEHALYNYLGDFSKRDTDIGSGFPVHSYRPKDTDKKALAIQYTFQQLLALTATEQSDNAAVAAFRSDIEKKKYQLPRQDEIHHRLGDETWNWPVFMETKSKPMKASVFDPKNGFLNKGAHMPLITFFGGACDGIRSKPKHKERQGTQRRAGRDCSWAHQQNKKPSHPKGVGKGKGRPTGVGDDQARNGCEEHQRDTASDPPVAEQPMGTYNPCMYNPCMYIPVVYNQAMPQWGNTTQSMWSNGMPLASEHQQTRNWY